MLMSVLYVSEYMFIHIDAGGRQKLISSIFLTSSPSYMSQSLIQSFSKPQSSSHVCLSISGITTANRSTGLGLLFLCLFLRWMLGIQLKPSVLHSTVSTLLVQPSPKPSMPIIRIFFSHSSLLPHVVAKS